MLNIPSLEKLVHQLSRLPGVGPKTAQRLAYHILKSPEEYSVALSEALQQVRDQVQSCPQCFNYTDQEICRFCKDPHRANDILCIVEEPSDILRIEASGAFRGRYHVLQGVISPLEGIGPQDLRIRELMDRLNTGLEGVDGQTPIKEIIMALDADLEGDTTVLYLAKQLGNRGLKITRLAHGVPIGSDIEYIDDRTMGRALENRNVIF
jgi:recombination protein RecR